MRFLAAVIVFALAISPALARGPETLTQDVKDHLASLAPLRTGDRAQFDGKPVLVKFWASW